MKEKEERVVRSRENALYAAQAQEKQNAWRILPVLILIVPMVGIMIVVSGGMVVASIMTGSSDMILVAVMLLFVGLLMAAMGVFLPYILLARVPLMIFEDGFFSGVLPPNHFVMKTVDIWKWDSIRRVELSTTSMQQNTFTNLIIYRKSGKKNIVGSTPDLLEAMNHLAMHVPETLDDSVKEYLLDWDEYQEHPDKSGSFNKRMQMGSWRFLVTIGVTTAVAYMFLFMGSMGGFGIIIALVLGVVMFGISLGMLPMIKKQYVKYILFNSKTKQDGTIHLKKTLFSRLLLRQQDVLEADSILEVKRALFPMMAFETARVKTADGKEYEGDFEIFKWAEKLPYYYRGGDVIVNARGHPSEKFSLVRFSRGKLVLFTAGLIGPFLIILAVLGLLSPGSSLGMQNAMIIFQLLIVVAIMAFLPFIMIFAFYFQSKISRISNTNVRLKPGKVLIIDHEGVKTKIPVKEIESVERVDGRFMSFAKMKTKDKEVYEIPISRFEALQEHLGRSGIMPEEEKGFSEYDLTSRVKYEPGKYLKEGFSMDYHSASGAKVIKVSDNLRLGKRRGGGKKKAPPRPKEGKGMLWFEEDDATLKKRRENMFKIALLVGGICVGIGLPFLIGGLIWGSFDSILFGSIFGGTFIFIGLLFIFLLGLQGGAMKRYKFYETGIETQKILSKKTLFFPYGRYSNLSEDEDKISGKYLRLLAKDQSVAAVVLPRTIKDIDTYIPMIRARVGKVEYEEMPEVEGLFDLKMLRGESKLTYYIVLQCILPPLLFLMFVVFLFLGSNMLPLLLLMGGASAGFGAIIIWFIAVFKQRKMPTPSIRKKMAVMAVVSAVVIGGCCASMVVGAATSSSIASYDYERHARDPDSIQGLYSGTYQGSRMFWDGAVDVKGDLVLRDCNLFVGTQNDTCGIWVHPRGSLTMINTTLNYHAVGSNPSGGGYSGSLIEFEVHGSLLLEGCIINDLYGNPDQFNFDGGIEIYSQNAVINDCLFEYMETNGVLVSKGKAEITNCRFSDVRDDAVEVSYGEAEISDCEFEDCDWGVFAIESGNTAVQNCRFGNGTVGVFSTGSTILVQDCDFLNIQNAAIKYSGGDITVERCTYTNCNQDFRKDNDELMMTICFVATPLGSSGLLIILYLAGLGFVYYNIRKSRRRNNSIK